MGTRARYVRRRAWRACLTASLAAAMLAVVVAPAMAQQSHIRIFNVEDSSLCLTEGVGGNVFLSKCHSHYGDAQQHWQSWEGGWTKNVRWGDCLQADVIFGDELSVKTGGCLRDNVFQYWRHWSGGWKQWQGWPPHFPPGCLSRLFGHATEVTLYNCGNPTGGDHPRMLWKWVWVPNT